MKKFIYLLMVLLISSNSIAQSIEARTDKFSVDVNQTRGLPRSVVPTLNWQAPIPDISYSEENRFKVKFTVESNSVIKNVVVNIRDYNDGTSRGTLTLTPEEGQNNYMVVDRTLNLLDGESIIEIVAENLEGVKAKSQRRVRVGADAILASTRLDRTDYALIFATDKYDNWSDLVNPIFDSRAIAEEIKKTYGFQVDLVENPTQADVLRKLREYAEKKYKPLDQLFIFFAGHGTYDETFGEGFIVTRESAANDEGKTSYLSHNRLRSIVNNIPSEHIFLVMDVCFGGTFDEAMASARSLEEEVYREQDKSEFIARKLTMKTRRYITSGGKTYVSDGIPGQHSPFAKKFIEALKSQGGKDGMLTTSEIFGYVEKLPIQPRQGAFGSNQPNSDFLFIVR